MLLALLLLAPRQRAGVVVVMVAVVVMLLPPIHLLSRQTALRMEEGGKQAGWRTVCGGMRGERCLHPGMLRPQQQEQHHQQEQEAEQEEEQWQWQEVFLLLLLPSLLAALQAMSHSDHQYMWVHHPGSIPHGMLTLSPLPVTTLIPHSLPSLWRHPFQLVSPVQLPLLLRLLRLPPLVLLLLTLLVVPSLVPFPLPIPMLLLEVGGRTRILTPSLTHNPIRTLTLTLTCPH